MKTPAYNPKWLALMTLLLAFATPVPAAENPAINLNLEEPSNGSIFSGIRSIRGFAVAPITIDRIEWTFDGTPQGTIPYGGTRPDVQQAFPNLPNSRNSGFARTLNYSNLSAGQHTISVRAVDINGDDKLASATFTVSRFDDSFIEQENVSLEQASGGLVPEAQGIVIQNMIAGGQSYNVALQWNAAIQGFAIVNIVGGGGGGGGSARWVAANGLCCPGGTHTFSVTIDGVTKRSVNNTCDPNDPILIDPPATVTVGSKNYAASALSPACNVNTSGSGTVVFDANKCYAFILEIDENDEQAINFGEVDCSQPPFTTQAGALSESAWLPTNVPLGGSKVLPLQGSDDNYLEMRKAR